VLLLLVLLRRCTSGPWAGACSCRPCHCHMAARLLGAGMAGSGVPSL
jgi:hypothetical protein